MLRKRPAGYVPEVRADGSVRHRVRVEGNKRLRITIPGGPEDPTFWQHYYAARAGQQLENRTAPPATPPTSRTFRALCESYLTALERQVEGGQKSPLTLKQRRSLLRKVCDMPAPEAGRTVGDYHPDMPPAAMLHIQDSWGAKTAQADVSMKAIRVMYDWAIPREWAKINPARAVKNVHRSQGGAVPWSPDDMKRFLARHAPESVPWLWMILQAFTGARRDDICRLGRDNEVKRDGIVWLEWQPRKKGSAFVSIPMFPQLFDATRQISVIGPTYLLNAHGRPFKNGNVLGNKVQVWTREAGLGNRSSHGLRKSLAELLAEQGATSHQIMSVLAHTQTKTTEIYTKGAERTRLAKAAMDSIAGFRIG